MNQLFGQISFQFAIQKTTDDVCMTWETLYGNTRKECLLHFMLIVSHICK